MVISVVKIQHDYKTLERAGAAGMFQVVSCIGVDENGQETTISVDQGMQFYSDAEVIEYIKSEFKDLDCSKVDIESDD